MSVFGSDHAGRHTRTAGPARAERGKTVEIVGLNDPSARLHGRLSGELA
ncbi:sulfate transporter [Saccharomonospora azurea SZMC 14600]|nr:hypothetical protein [Saccharomonospora azurea]EHK83104.1 sulfate transporter [Saccharomonospora azurea SZMC 14600]